MGFRTIARARTLRQVVSVSTGFAVALAAVGLAACNTGAGLGSSLTSQAVVAPTVAVNITELPGNYGLASYHKPEDKERTVAQAKVACNNPYKIGTGANGGVTMYLADQSEPSEVFIKVAQNGQSYLGPRGAPGMPQDRLILSNDDGVLVADWVDPGVRTRYGTMVFVRCT